MLVVRQKVQHRIAHFFTVALIAVVAAFAIPRGATAQGAEATTYNDWTLNCGVQSESGARVCEMYQTIFTDETRTNPILTVVVGYPQAGNDPGMLLVLPLGISLPAGVFLQIDQSEPQPVPVERCEPDGCRIELLLPSAYLDALKAGAQATVYAHDGQRQRFAVTFSLSGFTAGLNAIAAN